MTRTSVLKRVLTRLVLALSALRPVACAARSTSLHSWDAARASVDAAAQHATEGWSRVQWPQWPPDLAGLVLRWGYSLESHWDSCAAWVSNGPAESLAFLLHDAGFDVWLGNVRGSTWGLRHRRLTPRDEAFWRFSWDDMAQQDVPAMLRHIVDVTGRRRVHYVGHSQGTTLALAALAQEGSLARETVSIAVLLAPVAFAGHTRSLLLRTLADLRTPELVQRFGERSFLPGTADGSYIFSEVCHVLPRFCLDFLSQLCGASKQLNATRLPQYLQFVPAGTSVMNMEHWAQGVRTAGHIMRRFDYGADCASGHWPATCNQARYNGSRTPPQYPVDAISTPIALLSGSEDVLATPEDVAALLDTLRPRTVVYAQQYPGMAHLDFTWGVRAHETVYPDAIRLLREADERDSGG